MDTICKTNQLTTSLFFYFFFSRNVKQHQEKTRGKTFEKSERISVVFNKQNMLWLQSKRSYLRQHHYWFICVYIMLRKAVSVGTSSKKCHWNVIDFICFRRGLTPPHRVKSISMASFTPEEIDFLKSRGNEVIEMFNFLIEEVLDWFNCLACVQYCKLVWMAHYNAAELSSETKDEQKFKDHLVAKYEKKR